MGLMVVLRERRQGDQCGANDGRDRMREFHFSLL
jgi:hypothetical protein